MNDIVVLKNGVVGIVTEIWDDICLIKTLNHLKKEWFSVMSSICKKLNSNLGKILYEK